MPGVELITSSHDESLLMSDEKASSERELYYTDCERRHLRFDTDCLLLAAPRYLLCMYADVPLGVPSFDLALP